jgi:hypothetical protein
MEKISDIDKKFFAGLNIKEEGKPTNFMPDIQSLSSTLAERLKNIKSAEDLSLVFSQENKKCYWAAMHKYLLYDKSISFGAKIFWLILEDRGDAEGYSYYGQKKISAMIGRSKKIIQGYETELIEAGWLTLVHRGGNSNEYWVIWPSGGQNPKLNSMIKKSIQSEKRY